MKYVIQIAHPNDALKGQWTTTDVVSDESMIKDALDSPSFERSDGLIVRVWKQGDLDDFFIGVYGNDKYTSIGKASLITQQWKNSVRPTNLIDAYRDCDKAQWIMLGVKNIISFSSIIETVFACTNLVMPHITDLPTRRLYEVGWRWVNRTASFEEVDKSYTAYINQDNSHVTSSVRYCIIHTILSIQCDPSSPRLGDLNQNAPEHAVGYARLALADIFGTRDDAYNPTLCNIIRSMIPFHDVCLGVARCTS